MQRTTWVRQMIAQGATEDPTLEEIEEFDAA